MNPDEYEKAKGPAEKSVIRVLAGKGFTVGQAAEILTMAAQSVRAFEPLTEGTISEIEKFEKLAHDRGTEVDYEAVHYLKSREELLSRIRLEDQGRTNPKKI